MGVIIVFFVMLTTGLAIALLAQHQSRQQWRAKVLADAQQWASSQAHRLSREWVVGQGVRWVGGLTPLELEHLVAELLRRDGCANVRVVGGSGDRGVDVSADTAKGRLVVQCKMLRAAVDSPMMMHFVGAMTHAGADVGAFVAPGGYTREALAIAAAHRIDLYDSMTLAQWARRLHTPRPIG